MQSESPRAQLRAVLEKWRDDLIDLSGRNRLLNFRPTRTATLEIRHPGAGAVLAGLATGWRFAELPDHDSEEGSEESEPALDTEVDGLVTQKATQPSLDASLRRLYRDSNQVFNDTGLWTLQLGAGFLRWREPGAEGYNLAPLLLVPVRLDRIGAGLYRLIEEDGEDSKPNPALAVKMDQLGLAWPDSDDMKDLSSTLESVRTVVASQTDWEVTEDVVLATFRSHKEAMYRDLKDHEDQILAHPMVQAIGLGPRAGLPDDILDFDPADPDRIDELQPPEHTPLVLDADSSQRQCVAAALAGHSFVMDGPPGTGKSQTIANMIAALMHAGRSILFVSEKAAALDVVRNRLGAAGLDAFLLPLHSHHATRKEVAQELGSALLQRPKAAGGNTAENRKRLKRARRQLSAYAAAMNEVRPPLGRDLHGVIGRLDALYDVPTLPTGLSPGFDAEAFHDVLDAAEEIGDSWRPVAEGASFPWRGLIPASVPQPRLQLLTEQSDALHRRLSTHQDLAGPLDLIEPDRTERLLALLDATADRPKVPVGWLTAPALLPLRQSVGAFIERLNELRDHQAAVGAEVGPDWDEVPDTLSTDASAEELALERLAPEGLQLAAATEAQLRRLATDFEASATMLRNAAATLADIAAVYGVPAPRTPAQAMPLCSLTDFARAAHRPEASWLSPQGRAAAYRAANELEARFVAVAQTGAVAGDTFSEKLLDIPDLPVVVRRFTEAHGIGKLSGEHRADKRLLAGLTVSGVWNKAAEARLPQAMAWYAAVAELRRAIAAYDGSLGRYWQGDRTDFQLIRGLLASADRIAALSPDVLDPSALARQVTAEGSPDFAICEAADSVRAELAQWRTTLLPAPRLSGRPRLGQEDLATASSWYAAHLAPLNAAADLIATVQTVYAGDPLTLDRARQAIGQVTALRVEREAFRARAHADAELLGVLYAGLDTDLGALPQALEWIGSVREDDEPFPESAAHALLGAEPDDELRRRFAAFRAAATDFVQLFEDPRRHELLAQLTGTFSKLRHLTETLRADRSGPDEWRTFRTAQETMRRFGLGDLVDRAAEQQLDGGSFRNAVERAVLQAWAEAVFRDDSRLTPVRAVQRDKLVAEFRELDATLVANAHAEVIEACNARRPRPNIGQAATIQHEAQKKSRHRPVRVLLDEAPDVIPLIKPCFMMSPLTVSQFLPPGYRFDVVIFDEASQVLPQDAVNCVYRGDSLIVAGDQKQLPPTNFFAQADDPDNDEYDEDVPDSYESLLDMCKASGLIRTLSLRWHYRSRHEGLIAFSNRRFYHDDLVTFPGALETGEDVGVTFTKVTGVYERGRSRRNPVEARAVAERVLHHYATRPRLSLGVVAMSDAQAHAIEDAVEDARADRPELDGHFSEDRLNGFFVKNLETVQGDERDVIILSVGYGPDENGKLTMAFGPLNRENGWRRLNVAVTRARHRVEVLASISGGEIREGDNSSLNHFKRYLDYAELGPSILENGPVPDDAAPESPFEESVLEALLDWGYDVQPQVGVGGYRIDLGVRHPHASGRFALGIECDGAMYHSSKAARDRDRLREEVLRGLGWELHRIWGTDWYRDRPEAQRRLREAVEAAIAPLPAQSEAGGSDGDGRPVEPEATVPAAPRAPATPDVTFVPAEADGGRDWARPYRKTRLDMPYPYYDMHEPEARGVIEQIFRTVVKAEAPIHIELLYRRAADVWYVERIGSRIRENLERTLKNYLKAEHVVTRRGDFIVAPAQELYARKPGDDIVRKVGEIAPDERKHALRGVIGESPGISEEELKTVVTRFFGWSRRGTDINRALSNDLTELAEDGAIEGLPDRIVLC